MTQYFEDMWLSLEKELSSFDSYSPSEFVSSPSSSSDNPNSPNNINTTNLDHQTYEDLLEIQLAPPPSNDKLRSSDRKERIQAIRELYNKTPTIINGSSLASLHKTACSLYKKGFIKQANNLLKTAESSLESFSYLTEDDNGYRALSYGEVDNKTIASVEFTDNNGETTIGEFDNLLDAIKFFKSKE